MDFKNFLDLVTIVNKDLDSFCNTFQYKRKELTGAGRTAGNNELFGNIKEEEGWAINKGGGIELQYHIAFIADEQLIRYGLGFSTQYVPFASNLISPIDSMRPFMKAFLELEMEITTILSDYSFIDGNKNLLKTPEFNEYVLFGKSIKFNYNNLIYSVDKIDYDNLLNDLKAIYPIYQDFYTSKYIN